MKSTKTFVSVNLNMSLKNALTKRHWQINKSVQRLNPLVTSTGYLCCRAD